MRYFLEVEVEVPENDSRTVTDLVSDVVGDEVYNRYGEGWATARVQEAGHDNDRDHAHDMSEYHTHAGQSGWHHHTEPYDGFSLSGVRYTL